MARMVTIGVLGRAKINMSLAWFCQYSLTHPQPKMQMENLLLSPKWLASEMEAWGFQAILALWEVDLE